jgi:hypothetical protein
VAVEIHGNHVVVDLLESLHWIEEFPESNIGLDTGYPDLVFRGFSQFLQENV